MLTKTQLDQIRAREQAATEGPWDIAEGACGPVGVLLPVKDNEGMRFAVAWSSMELKPSAGFADKYEIGEQAPANMRFIGAARADIPALLETVGELQEMCRLVLDAYRKNSGTGLAIGHLAKLISATQEEPPKAGEGE